MRGSNLSQIITLTVGDWGGDGHNMTENFSYNSNYTCEDVMAAYQRAIVNGVPDITSQCYDYEDDCLSEEFIDSWVEKSKSSHPQIEGFNNAVLACRVEPIDAAVFAEIYLFIAKTELPDLVYKPVGVVNAISIGGYGLFYD